MPITRSARAIRDIILFIVDSYGRVTAPRSDQLLFSFTTTEADNMILTELWHFCVPAYLFLTSASLNREVLG